MSEFDSLLDEMHPCCLKELENEKRHKELTNQLRVGDRSNLRLDEIKKAFVRMKPSPAMSCHCCENSCDYPLLRKLREEVEEAKAVSDKQSTDLSYSEDLHDEDDDEFGI